jgi:hypothetical protein
MERLIAGPIPLPSGLVVKKALKISSVYSGRQSYSGVANGDQDLAALAAFRPDREHSAGLLHRLDTIEHEVHQYLAFPRYSNPSRFASIDCAPVAQAAFGRRPNRSLASPISEKIRQSPSL